MAKAALLPLALLYTDSRREVSGATRFQKLAFLAQKETDLDELFQFRSDKYGPFSPTLHSVLSKMEDRGWIKKQVETTSAGNEIHRFRLTQKGEQIARDWASRDEDEVDKIFRQANEIKQDFNQMPMERLLRYVYKRYPEYTDKSEIADEIV